MGKEQKSSLDLSDSPLIAEWWDALTLEELRVVLPMQFLGINGTISVSVRSNAIDQQV